MKVKELINDLSELNEELEVYFASSMCYSRIDNCLPVHTPLNGSTVAMLSENRE